MNNIKELQTRLEEFAETIELAFIPLIEAVGRLKEALFAFCMQIDATTKSHQQKFPNQFVQFRRKDFLKFPKRGST